MTDWTAFAGFSGVVVLLLLLLARASQSMLSEASSDGPGDGPSVPIARDYLERGPMADDGPTGATPDGDANPPDATTTDGTAGHRRQETMPAGPTTAESASDRDVQASPGPTADSDAAADVDWTSSADRTPPADRTTSADPTPGGPQRFGSLELLANVLVTHGLFAGLVAGAAVYWEVPASALGVTGPALPAIGWGVAAGLALYVGNEVGAVAAARLGIDHAETLRELLAPDSAAGWAILLCGVLPVVAVGEELIFRGVLVGALSAGFALPVWGLAIASSVAFALGHGAQGTGGIVVTGLLGFALAAAFVLSGSLLLVIVAHYVVNALEFVVHEGFDVEWAAST